MTMRKKVIQNFHIKSGYSNYNFIGTVNSNLLRREENKQFANPVASKVSLIRGKNWTDQSDGKYAHSVIIIDDSRQEIAQVGHRGLITTSLIFDELVNCNRGVESPYDLERNKFFVKDNTKNATDLHSPTQIHLLDLLWYMVEENLDAIEIKEPKAEDKEQKFLSKRYRDIVESDLCKAQKDAPTTVKPAYTEMVRKFTEQDEGKLDWQNSSYHRDWDIGGYHEYSPQVEALKEYYSYRRNREEKPVKRFASWLKEYMSDEGKVFGSHELMKMIARHFGYVTDEGDDYFMGLALQSKVVGDWKRVRHSEFKRNKDWFLDEGNFIRTEVLKLRRQMNEGTFDE